MQNGAKTIAEVHSVRIEGLTAGRRYRYRVVTREVESHEGIKVLYGNYAATDVYRNAPLVFTTSDPESPTISFAVVNDIHGQNELLESHSCVKAVICGHNHTGYYTCHNGIHHITIKAMVESTANRFVIVSVSDDHFVVKGFGDQPDYALSI